MRLYAANKPYQSIVSAQQHWRYLVKLLTALPRHNPDRLWFSTNLKHF